MPKFPRRHLLVLIAMCGLIASGVGLVTNVAGLFFTPVSEELGILRGEVSLTLTICNICVALGGMVAPKFMGMKSPRPLILGATVALAASTAGLSFCHGIVAMYALCVVRGFAAGIVGMVFATTVVSNWFVAAIGLVTSIVFGFSGIAGAVFSPIVSGIIQSSGWRMGYLVLAVLHVVLSLPALLFVPSFRPEESGLAAYGAEEGTRTAAVEPTAKTAAAPLSMVLFAIVLGFSVIGSGTTSLPQHFSGMAENFGLGAAVGATMLSASMVANTVGKIVLGALVDRFGGRKSILLYCCLVIVAILMLLFVRGPLAMVVAAVFYGLCYSIGTVGITMMTRDVFGVENYTRVYPTMSFGGNVANAAFSSIIGFMYDFSGGYTLTLWVMLAMASVTAVLVVVGYGKAGKAA